MLDFRIEELGTATCKQPNAALAYLTLNELRKFLDDPMCDGKHSMPLMMKSMLVEEPEAIMAVFNQWSISTVAGDVIGMADAFRHEALIQSIRPWLDGFDFTYNR